MVDLPDSHYENEPSPMSLDKARSNWSPSRLAAWDARTAEQVARVKKNQAEQRAKHLASLGVPN